MTSTQENREWWAGVAALLSGIVRDAPDHLPATADDDAAMTWQIAQEIVQTMAAARAAADSAAGAFDRVARTERPAPAAAPPPAEHAPMVRPPHDGAWASTARPQTRGWGQ